ncbi:MAG: hypothetical protein U0264_15680 [Candidatus Kapaibacterium sp.]
MPDTLLQPVEISPIATISQKKKRFRGTGQPMGRPKKPFFNKQEFNVTVFMDMQEYSLANDLLQVMNAGDLPDMFRLLLKEEAVRRHDDLKAYWAECRRRPAARKEGEPEE